MGEAVAARDPHQHAEPGSRKGAAARELDKQARFFSFVDEYQDQAVRVAWRLVGGDHSAAEDIVQDAFFKAWRGLHRFREDSGFTTWFYRILVNEARAYRRWRGVRDRWDHFWKHDDSDESSHPMPDPSLQRRLSAALDQLPQGQREVFVLVHLEGFTVEETAQYLGKATGTVKSHLYRALQSLRTQLGDLRDVPRSETENSQ